jgi:hypothetical protein
MENRELNATKQAVFRVVAFRTSAISVRRDESLRDLYKPQSLKTI